MASHMAKMKNNAIVGNIGHFDNEIDMAGVLGWQVWPANCVPDISCTIRRGVVLHFYLHADGVVMPFPQRTVSL